MKKADLERPALGFVGLPRLLGEGFFARLFG